MWDQTCLFILPGEWTVLPREGITETHSGFGASVFSFGLMTSPAWAAWIGRKQIQNPWKLMLCAGREPQGQPLKGKQDLWNNNLVSELKWEAVKDRWLQQICPCLRGGCCWICSHCEGEGEPQTCARGTGGKNQGGKKLKAKSQQNEWALGQALQGRWMALLVMTAATENAGDNGRSWQIFNDYHQLFSPNLISFSAG